MLKINIQEFQGYDNKAMYEYLLLHNEIEFEITIDKQKLGKPGDYDEPDVACYVVFAEYYQAAYAGQKLSEIADSFAYYVPSPLKEKPFLFEITTSNMEQLSDLLYLLVSFYNFYTSNEDQFIEFDSAAASFINAAYDPENDIEPNTWGLLDIAAMYINKTSI